jgi:hypothetical protein
MRNTYLLFFLLAMGPITYANTSRVAHPLQQPAGDTTYRIIHSAENTYGYEILIKKTLFIHQPCIPGMPGNKGFVRKSSAEKVARLVIKKIQKGIVPPTVTIKELDSMKINF